MSSQQNLEESRNKNSVLGVGIIGFGYAGEVIHAPLIESVPELTLVAVSTGRPERAEIARKRGYGVYLTATELLSDSRIDLVIIATPHDTHLALTLEACSAGKHVVCDKLMALNVSEAEMMVRAAEDAGVVLSIFHNRRWDGDFLSMASAVGGGSPQCPPLSGLPAAFASSVGDLIRIRSFVQMPGKRAPELWRAKQTNGGGIFSDWGAHLLDQALLLHHGSTKSVYCSLHYADPAISVETGSLCIIEFEDGSSHVIEANQMYHELAKGYECWGTNGRLLITGFDPQEELLKKQVRGLSNVSACYHAELHRDGNVTLLNTPPTGDWAAYYRNIVAHILHGKELAVSPESVLRMMRLREAALQSAEQNQVIRTVL